MKKYITNKYSLIAAVCLTLLFSSCKEDLFDSIPYGEATFQINFGEMEKML